jgi:diacylglycerol kinase (ATP)
MQGQPLPICSRIEELMKTKLIVNPVSGTDEGLKVLPAINARLREAGPVDVVLTIGPGDATDAARRAVEEGYERVVSAGGDGTLNEALNGIASVEGGLDAVTLGVIPIGTGNDFATALGLPQDAEAAAAMLLEATPRAVDVWRVNDRCFVNVSGGGFLAEVSDAVDTRLKTVAGKLAYLIGGVQVMWSHDPMRARVAFPRGGMRVTDLGASTDPAAVNVERVEDFGVEDLYAFAACNAPLMGGGHVIGPLARMDDGQLDLCLIRAASMTEFLAVLRQVPGGDHVQDARVIYVRAPAIELSFDRRIKINTDGQVLESDRCSYALIGRARILAPPPASA